MQPADLCISNLSPAPNQSFVTDIDGRLVRELCLPIGGQKGDPVGTEGIENHLQGWRVAAGHAHQIAVCLRPPDGLTFSVDISESTEEVLNDAAPLLVWRYMLHHLIGMVREELCQTGRCRIV